jgi:hypothetical protein
MRRGLHLLPAFLLLAGFGAPVPGQDSGPDASAPASAVPKPAVLGDAAATTPQGPDEPENVPANASDNPESEEAIPKAFPEDRYLTMWDKNPFQRKVVKIEQAVESFAKDWALSGISASGGVFTVRIFNKQTGKFERLKQGQPGGDFQLVSVNYDKDRAKSSVKVSRGSETAELKYDDSLMSRPVTVQNTMAAPAGQNAQGTPGNPANPGTPGAPATGNPRLPPGAQAALQRGPNGQPLPAGSIRPGMPGASNPNANPVNPATGAPIVNPATGGMPGAPGAVYTQPSFNAPGSVPGAVPGAPPPVSRRRQLIPAPIQQSQPGTVP